MDGRGLDLEETGLVLAISIASFALVNGFILADLIPYGTAAGTDGTADEGALASADETADDRTSRGRSTDDFGSGVMLVIVSGLGGFGALVGGLGEGAEGKRERKSKGEKQLDRMGFHRTNLYIVEMLGGGDSCGRGGREHGTDKVA